MFEDGGVSWVLMSFLIKDVVGESLESLKVPFWCWNVVIDCLSKFSFESDEINWRLFVTMFSTENDE